MKGIENISSISYSKVERGMIDRLLSMRVNSNISEGEMSIMYTYLTDHVHHLAEALLMSADGDKVSPLNRGLSAFPRAPITKKVRHGTVVLDTLNPIVMPLKKGDITGAFAAVHKSQPGYVYFIGQEYCVFVGLSLSPVSMKIQSPLESAVINYPDFSDANPTSVSETGRCFANWAPESYLTLCESLNFSYRKAIANIGCLQTLMACFPPGFRSDHKSKCQWECANAYGRDHVVTRAGKGMIYLGPIATQDDGTLFRNGADMLNYIMTRCPSDMLPGILSLLPKCDVESSEMKQSLHVACLEVISANEKKGKKAFDSASKGHCGVGCDHQESPSKVRPSAAAIEKIINDVEGIEIDTDQASGVKWEHPIELTYTSPSSSSDEGSPMPMTRTGRGRGGHMRSGHTRRPSYSSMPVIPPAGPLTRGLSVKQINDLKSAADSV